jgi:hypothetical protein
LIPIILDKLKAEVDKVITEDFQLVYIFKNDIEKFKQENHPKLEPKDKEFLIFYAKMTNLHLVNIYFATLGYFEDSKILDTDYIQFFYKVTQSKEVRDFDGDSLLHTYPFAVKMIISDNEEKAKYFKNNWIKMYNEFGQKGNDKHLTTKKNAHFKALFIENTLIDRKKLIAIYNEEAKDGKNAKKVKDIFENELTDLTAFEKKSNGLKEKILLKLGKVADVSYGKDDIKFFIYPNFDKEFDKYQNYLDKGENDLRDILSNSLKSINEEDPELAEQIKMIFYGAIDTAKEPSDDVRLKKINSKGIVEKINDTWANVYSEGYTIVRIVKVDKKLLLKKGNDKNNLKQNLNLWFRPIGCIAIKHNDEEKHLFLTRSILAIKYELVEFISKEISHGVIQEAISTLISKKAIDDVNHSVKRYINIRQRSNNILYEYNKGLLYERMEKEGFDDELEYFINLYQEIDKYAFALNKISSIRDILSENKQKYKTDIKDVLDESFEKNIIEFLSVAEQIGMQHIIDSKKIYKIRKENLKRNSLILNINPDQFTIFLFELLFNAFKAAYYIDDKEVSVEIYSYSGGIDILNKTPVKNLKKFKDNNNRPYSKYFSNPGVGTMSIKDMLEKNSYGIRMLIIDDTDFLSTYAELGYNTCIQIYNLTKGE